MRAQGSASFGGKLCSKRCRAWAITRATSWGDNPEAPCAIDGKMTLSIFAIFRATRSMSWAPLVGAKSARLK